MKNYILNFSEFNKINEQNYEYGCVMLHIDKAKILELYPSILEEDVYTENNGEDYGLKDYEFPHVTILYGLHYNEIPVREVQDIFKDIDEVEISITGISMFDNDKFDVLKFTVESPALTELNKKLRKFPYTNSYDDYVPHMTIGYLKKGTAKKYLTDFKNPITVSSDKIVYSMPGHSDDDSIPLNENANRKSENLSVKFSNITKEQKNELMKLMNVINWCGSVGASRTIKVTIDGDGDFRAKCDTTITLSKEDKDSILDDDSYTIELV